MKHDHWDIVECSYCREQEAPTDEGLHSEYVELQGAVEELLASLEARKKLDEGFGGMGYNALVEKASGFNGHIRVLHVEKPRCTFFYFLNDKYASYSLSFKSCLEFRRRFFIFLLDSG